MKNWIIVSMLLMCGCTSQFASTGEHVYQKAKNGSSMAQPPDVNPEDTSHYYDVPSPKKQISVSIEPPED